MYLSLQKFPHIQVLTTYQVSSHYQRTIRVLATYPSACRMYNVHTIKLLAICPSTCHIPTKYKIRELSSPTTEPPLCSHGLDPRVSTLGNVRNDNVSRDQIKMLQWPAAGFFGFFCSFCIGQQFKWAACKKCRIKRGGKGDS